ncbi:unnamed protein product [Effrenium voratum]|nr:unnamed protein product [Effrenium voratum]CAJ1439693.1 unnamed protein product [Effrenium voratum]
MNQVGSAWGLGFEDPVRYLVGIEAGAIGTFAALRGMDGMRVVIGALLGVLVSASMLQWHPLHFIPDHKWLEVIWYSVVVCLFTVVLYTNKHLKMLAILSAGLGGAFCASAIAFAVTNLAAGGYLNFLDQVLPGLTPKGGTWVQFFRMLWSTQNPVVGLFVGSKYNPVVEGKQFNVDRMADISVWLIFWIVGCVVQLRRIKSKPQQAVSAMTEPLLGELPK